MTKADNAWNRGIPLERRAEERCPEQFADGYDMGVEDDASGWIGGNW